MKELTVFSHRSDPPEPFDLVEETRHQVAFLVEHPINWAIFAPGRVALDMCRCTEGIGDKATQVICVIRGQHPDARLAARQERSRPVLDDFESWLIANRARVSAKSLLGEALKYIAKYWGGLTLFLDDGRIEMDSNSMERTIRPIALNRKNALFAGHDAGAQDWAMIASLVETCKLNAVDLNRPGFPGG